MISALNLSPLSKWILKIKLRDIKHSNYVMTKICISHLLNSFEMNSRHWKLLNFLWHFFQQILNLNLLLDLWLCSAGLRYLDSKWQIIFGWTVAKQTLHRYCLHHHRHFQPHHSALLLRMLRCSERSEMSFVNLRCVHDVAAGHLGGRRGPLLHLQGPGGQHNTGGDDRGHSKLWPGESGR